MRGVFLGEASVLAKNLKVSITVSTYGDWPMFNLLVGYLEFANAA